VCVTAFLYNGPPGNQLSQNALDKSSPNFQDMGRCYGNRCLARIGKNWHAHLHSVRWHSTTDGQIATWMRALTPPMTTLVCENLVNFGPVTRESCLRRANYTPNFFNLLKHLIISKIRLCKSGALSGTKFIVFGKYFKSK